MGNERGRFSYLRYKQAKDGGTRLSLYTWIVEIDDEKIYHHHTPRFYLLPWADAAERLMWLGYGKIIRSKVTVVGGENDFYRLRELTSKDIFLMREFIKQLPELGRKGHEQLLEWFALPPALKSYLERIGRTDSDSIRVVDAAISNLNENYHTSIENSFRPYLDAMLKGDASFYNEDQSAMEFLRGLSVQILRTKAVKDRAVKHVKGLFEDIERVWPIISHILAVTMGGSFFVDRKRFKIVLIDNHTQVPFITSDQPIINLLSPAYSFDVPEKVELYYPISPTKAMLYLEQENPAHASSPSISTDEAHAYNVLIADHSGQQIFSNSEEYLKIIKKYIEGRRQLAAIPD